MKERNDVLKYTLKGEVVDKTDDGVIEVATAKSSDELSLEDMFDDIRKFFDDLPEAAIIDFTLQAKEVKK